MSHQLPDTTPTEYLADGVWHVTVGSRPAHGRQLAAWLSLPAGWQGLLAITDHRQLRRMPTNLRAVRCPSLVRLQVFIDQGCDVPREQGACLPAACLAVPFAMACDTQLLEPWYIHQALGASADYERFAVALRSSEEYWLVHYLLEQGGRQDSLQMLARRYGVSVSHFRRLCRQALGGATKPALRDWRVARALLEAIGEGHSLTEVAQNQGYCSSSHFSRDVRELLGVAPSQLGNIVGVMGS
ncbi:helix-turn-helix domain-containing protein [Pseudomonas sp. BJa5]|uniref:helix-turn-helix domain-containing protein n=1 Tax=Pseudomonas sp. BJa5 TaxID=2936270 RepID=UPI00255A0462|nr:helix-turn-helix domain-containing protein [Pseudomonas sp. BGr12]MDL2421166.1 helix-turn-helix domain-containing protein [Pseudomonas sp. BGr12]